MQWIVKKIAWEAIRSLVVNSWESIKKQPWWDRAGIGVGWLTGLWAEVPLEGKIVMALTGYCLFMAIRQALSPYFPRRWESQGIEKTIVAESRRKPIIIPQYGEDDRGYQGLWITNEGRGAALSITMTPLQIGDESVRFTGAEVAYLKAGETRFFSLGNAPPTLIFRGWTGNSILMGMLQKRNLELDEGQEAVGEGLITYKDIQGAECKTKYEARVDNEADWGVVVRVVD